MKVSNVAKDTGITVTFGWVQILHWCVQLSWPKGRTNFTGLSSCWNHAAERVSGLNDTTNNLHNITCHISTSKSVHLILLLLGSRSIVRSSITEMKTICVDIALHHHSK